MEKGLNPDKQRGLEKQYGELIPVQLRLGSTALDKLTGLCLIDDTSVADQARRAIDVYIEQRLADPELPSLIDKARNQRTQDLS